jgi:hypothetical protein
VLTRAIVAAQRNDLLHLTAIQKTGQRKLSRLIQVGGSDFLQGFLLRVDLSVNRPVMRCITLGVDNRRTSQQGGGVEE